MSDEDYTVLSKIRLYWNEGIELGLAIPVEPDDSVIEYEEISLAALS